MSDTMQNLEAADRAHRGIYGPHAFEREDDGEDATFYATHAFGQHLDTRALSTVERVVGTLLVEEAPAVLDLCAGPDSHLPEGLDASRVVGIGLNEEELAANPRLTERRVQDLNLDPALPYEDESFDAVLITISVGYLTRPFALFREVGRVLKKGGLFLIVYSNRMHRTKAVRIWREATEAERQIIVEDFLSESQAFGEPSTFISMGQPRPKDDKYAGLGLPSDPIWAIYTERKGGSPYREPRPAIPPDEVEGPSREVVEKRKAEVKDTLRCPYCETELTQWEVPDSPFNEWPNDYMYICFNNECPYLLQGWAVMCAQGSPGFSYRLMYNPALNRCMPTPIPSLKAAKETVITPRG